MLEGVTLVDPGSTFLDASVVLGRDTVIQPNTMVLGASTIGEACTIGPGTVIRDSSIGDGSRVVASFVEEATIEGSVEVGPFSHLRPGAYLETGVHLGNFVEVKESRLERGVAAGHFSYIGDANIGAGANLGAGMVTCNYDGAKKQRTVVGEGAFIGCDTMLVAPVSVGPGAVTGAGAVVTKDVPPGRLAVGVPARIVESKRSHPS
jgi:bifunctional UDP-N-acetylglucosamine pyrophosphorylase/glucosamine-1-phosphate N-acetyltransferase